MSKKKERGNDDDVKREKPLQAVLLADSFTTTFRPVSLELPKVLFPLGSAPMLAYSLELLASNDVKQVFVFCCAHAEAIKTYIERSGWSSKLNIEIISSAVCTCVGDVMRELDQMNVIESDPFILISGDVVGTMDLKSFIEAHKVRRQQRAENIMTALFRQVGRSAKTRPLGDDLIIAINDVTKQIVYFSDDSNDVAKLPQQVLLEHESVTIHSDWLDCHIQICSPEVLWRFSENFDYLDIRKGLIASEVANLELGQYIFAEVVEGYAARSDDHRCYASISEDLIHRWAYPLVPELNLSGTTNFKRSHINAVVGGGSHRSLLYKDDGVQVSRSAKLSGGVMLGQNTVIGERSTIFESCLGSGCTVGEGAEIIGSILWKNVTVESGAVVDHALLCDGVVVKAGAKIGRGCMLSFGVVVGKGVSLEPNTRVTLSNAKDDDGFEDLTGNGLEEAEGLGLTTWDTKLLGTDGIGKRWPTPAATDEGAMSSYYSMGASELDDRHLHRHSAWPDGLDEDEDEKDDVLDDDEPAFESASEKAATSKGGIGSLLKGSVGASPISQAPSTASSSASADFEKAISDIIITGWATKDPVDALLMEVNCFKLAQNKTFDECLSGAVAAILSLAIVPGDDNAGKFLIRLKAQIQHWSPLLKKLTQGLAEEVAFVTAVELLALSGPNSSFLAPHFARVVKLFYDTEIISDDGILKWANARRSEMKSGLRNSDSNRLFESDMTQKLIATLEEESEEEDENSDSS